MIQQISLNTEIYLYLVQLMTPIKQPLITPLFECPSTNSMSMQTTSPQNLLTYHYNSTYMCKFLVWEQHNLFGHKYLKTVQILLDQIIRKILNKIVSVKFGLIHTVPSETESVYLQKVHKTCVVTHCA